MPYTLQEKCTLIKAACLKSASADLFELFRAMAALDCVGMHGPEHHFLDGACVLTACCNAGGNIDLEKALDALMLQSMKMPGAMCGQWGVCGAVTSVGAALAILDGTGPLSTADWGDHMALTSAVIGEMAKTGGPRCCKRDGLMALEKAAAWLRETRGLPVRWMQPRCEWQGRNGQCLGAKCPWHPEHP